MRDWTADLLGAALVSLMCVAFIAALPAFIDMQENNLTTRTAAASGSAVPASVPATPPTPCDDTHSPLLANLNDGPGRGQKTASGPGRHFYEADHE